MPQPHPSNPVGVVLPRYRVIGADKIVNADRIETVDAGMLRLESGLRVTLDDDVMKKGPSNTGDYLVIDGDTDTLVRGDDFEAKYLRVLHGIDIPEVSAALDPVAGSVNKPVNAADPEHPATPNQVPVKQSADEAVTKDVEAKAQPEAPKPADAPKP